MLQSFGNSIIPKNCCDQSKKKWFACLSLNKMVITGLKFFPLCNVDNIFFCGLTYYDLEKFVMSNKIGNCKLRVSSYLCSFFIVDWVSLMAS